MAFRISHSSSATSLTFTLPLTQDYLISIVASVNTSYNPAPTIPPLSGDSGSTNRDSDCYRVADRRAADRDADPQNRHPRRPPCCQLLSRQRQLPLSCHRLPRRPTHRLQHRRMRQRKRQRKRRRVSRPRQFRLNRWMGIRGCVKQALRNMPHPHAPSGCR